LLKVSPREVKPKETPKVDTTPKGSNETPKKNELPPKDVSAPQKGVQGIVTFSGKPVDQATISFVSGAPDFRVYEATTNAEGSYQAAEVAEGNYTITISAVRGDRNLLPEKYASPQTSPLKGSFSKMPASFDLKLE
jgi:hypothetical protein